MDAIETTATGAVIEERFAALMSEWVLASAPKIPDEGLFGRLEEEAAALLADGKWESGPEDLLSVLGRHGDELFHSAMIAWLARPAGRHGLGRSFVTRLLERCWPGENLTLSGPISVETEVTNSGLSTDGAMHSARADIIVRADGLIVVIENKVGAEEGVQQCERLYWSWAGKAPDVRWVFLSPSGLEPKSVDPARARAWTTLTYRDVREALVGALSQAGDDRPGHLGRATVRQYLATLDAHQTFTGGNR